jgi:hypothetical protein
MGQINGLWVLEKALPAKWNFGQNAMLSHAQ